MNFKKNNYKGSYNPIKNRNIELTEKPWSQKLDSFKNP